MIFLTATPSPTRIPIDDLPQEFGDYMFDFFDSLFDAMRSVIIPFTHISVYDAFIGTIVVGCIFYGVALIYGKGGDSTKHE